MKKLIVQFLKFAVVGGLAFLIDAGIYVGLTALFGDRLHLLFNVLSFSVSVIFNYICSMRFVFKGKAGMSRRTEMLIFILLSVIGLGINEAVMWLLVDVAHIEGAVQCLLRGMAGEKIGQAISGLSAKVIATVVVLFWNFISRKVFLEEKANKASPHTEALSAGEASLFAVYSMPTLSVAAFGSIQVL